MEFCGYFGPIVQFSKTGDHPDVHRCFHESNRINACTIAPSELKSKNGPIPDCKSCKLRPEIPPTAEDPPEADWITCTNRGPAIRKINSLPCQCDKTIYACTIHGEALKRLPTAKTSPALAEALRGVHICRDCNDVPKVQAGDSPK